MGLFGWVVSNKYVDYTASTITIAVVGILAAVYIFQSRLIYIPQFPPESRQIVAKPSAYNFKQFKEITLVTKDGVDLHTFWIPSQKGDTGKVPTILFLHANAGNMGHRLPIIKMISDRIDANYFMISYRGYGKSTGTPSEAGLKIDSQCALDYLLEKKEELGIDAKKIILYGQSIGGAVAIDLTARNQSRISALIIENTFKNIPSLIPHVVPILGWASAFCNQKWHSEQRMIEIASTSPLPHILFLCGAKDELIPPHHMQALYSIIRSHEDAQDRVEIKVFAHGTHNDTCIQPEYFQTLTDFIKKKMTLTK